MNRKLRLLWLFLVWIAISGFSLLERTVDWREEVALIDGSTIWLERTIVLGPDAFFRRGRGGAVRSTLTGDIPGVGNVTFEQPGYGPVTFDVVKGVPWVVTPIAGPKECEKYGFPKESVATFYFTGKEWVATPFENAPKGLRHNILQSYPISGDGSVVHANDQAKQPAKWNTIGVVLTERFIPQHIEWEHSCPRINPIASPEETQSVNQFLSLTSKPLVVEVLSAHHDVIRIDRVEDYRSIFAQRKFKDEFVIKDCDGKIGRAESSSPWVKQPGGLMISRPTAIRIELLAASKEKMNIWLPYAQPNGGHPSRIQCVDNKGYALINHWGKGTVELTIAQLDLTGGTWTNVWRFAYPPADFKDRGIIDFNETSGGFQLTVGEINHTTSRHEGDPWATIGSRYVLEIRHSPNHLAK